MDRQWIDIDAEPRCSILPGSFPVVVGRRFGVHYVGLDLPGQEIPTIGQRTSDFYNAQGNRVRVEWKLDWTTIREDEDAVATLLITGATNRSRSLVRIFENWRRLSLAS